MIEDPKKFLDGFQDALARFSKANRETRRLARQTQKMHRINTAKGLPGVVRLA